jgi:hypothetical protein
MLLHSLGVAVFFAFLLKTARRDRIRLLLLIFFIMVGASIVLAWIMYPFPRPLPGLS